MSASERAVKDKLATPPENLLRFSENFAASLFSGDRDRMPTSELQSMAERFGVELIPHEVRERSLLHNDAEGNWKFAHRSIMEYVLVNAVPNAKDSADLSNANLTEARLRGANLDSANLSRNFRFGSQQAHTIHPFRDPAHHFPFGDGPQARHRVRMAQPKFQNC